MDPEFAIEHLDRQLAMVVDGDVTDVYAWHERNKTLVRRALGNDHRLVPPLEGLRFVSGAGWSDETEAERRYFDDRARRGGVETAVHLMTEARFELALPAEGGQRSSVLSGVFLVHGHDRGRKHEVARVIDQLTGSPPTILHEVPNRGRTLMEKFEQEGRRHAFAVVLATADDLGHAKVAADLEPRARQNVIFEMGFFVGLMGRENVAVLYEEGVELPSDYGGVAYTSLDSQGAWRQELARELNAAGVATDANRLR